MRKALLLLALVLAGGLVASRLLTTDPAAFPPEDGPPNPLPPCPDTPNCVRTTWVYAVGADTLFTAARTALEVTGAEGVVADAAARRLDAVYRAGLFRDDVAVLVEPYGEGAALHLRSASRVGYSDLGVNGRRVRRIRDALRDALASAPR